MKSDLTLHRNHTNKDVCYDNQRIRTKRQFIYLVVICRENVHWMLNQDKRVVKPAPKEETYVEQ